MLSMAKVGENSDPLTIKWRLMVCVTGFLNQPNGPREWNFRGEQKNEGQSILICAHLPVG